MSSPNHDLDFVNPEWVIKYCDVMTQSYIEYFDRNTRNRNDSYSNGEFGGKLHALSELKRLMESLVRLSEKTKKSNKK